MIRLAVWFYGGMLGVAVALTALWGDWQTWFPARDVLGWAQDLASGVALGLVIVLVTQHLTPRFVWGRALTREFALIFGPLKSWEIAILALTSGVAEEALFRATLQPWLGWLGCGLLFGLLHSGPKREYLIWTIFAVSFGLLMGGVVEVRPGLLLPATAHFTVNFFNMKWIVARAQPARSE